MPFVDDPEHARRDNVLVVGPVEHAQPSSSRARVMNAPQVVVLELEGGRRLEARHRAALRIQSREHAPDDAVLSGRVDALEHQQHAPPGLGPEPPVQLLELVV
jgi:hypothetical protein